MSNSSYISADQARQKLQAYCAYQERCHQEVVAKMQQLGLAPTLQETLLLELLRDNFLNEERFARAYARGKFRIKHYGRNRIRQELQRKQIGAKLIELALTEIDAEEYEQVLDQQCASIVRQTRETHPFKKRKKCTDYLLRKGFEYDLICELLPAHLQAENPADAFDWE